MQARALGMSRQTLLWITGLVTLALFVALAVIDTEMSDTAGPGIIGFELAATEDRAHEILDDWGSDGRDAARLSLWLDYPYMIAYAAFWALAISALRDASARRGWHTLARIGAVAVALPLLGALCDAIENVGLLLALGRHGGGVAPLIGTVFASIKFLLLGAATVYVVVALVRLGYDRIRRRGAYSTSS